MPDYDEWASWHGSNLGIPSNIEPRTLGTWVSLLVEWTGIFQEGGWSPEEMMTASRELITTQIRLVTVADHRAGLHLILMKNRSVTVRRQPAAGEVDYGTCTLCGETGFVIVPHLGGVKDGRWEWGPTYQRRVTCAVLCRCPRGRRMKAGGNGSQTLEQYQEFNPDWQEQLDLDREERRAMTAAGPQSQSVRESLRRLVEKWKMPE